MKKLLFLILLLFPFVVLADTELFTQTTSIKDNNILITETTPYKDGYVVIAEKNLGESFALEYINKQGETIKSKDLAAGYLPAQLVTYNDSIILMRYSRTVCTFESYDENLEKQNELSISNCEPDFVMMVNSIYDHFITLKDGYIYYYIRNNDAGNIGKVKADLSSSEIITMTDEEIESLLPNLYYLHKIYELYPSTYLITHMDSNDKYIAVSIYELSPSCPEDTDEFCNGQKIIIYDKDLNVVKEFIIYNNASNHPSGKQVMNVRFVHNYLVLSYMVTDSFGQTLTAESYLGGEIGIYDLNWNLVQTIEIDKYSPMMTKKTDIGFIYIARNYTGTMGFNDEEINLGAFYTLAPPIEVETKDNGEVTVPTNAVVGETVTIEVTPSKGYVLGELIVIDEAGNKLPVTNNTFVMGTSKVTVRAIFVPENPKTGNFYVILIGLIATITGILLVVQKKKLDFLK